MSHMQNVQESSCCTGCCGNTLPPPINPIEANRVFMRAQWIERDLEAIQLIIDGLMLFLEDPGGDENAAFAIVEQYERENNPDGVVGMASLCLDFYTLALIDGNAQTARRWIAAAKCIQKSKLYFIPTI